jgi:hypothetical protein
LQFATLENDYVDNPELKNEVANATFNNAISFNRVCRAGSGYCGFGY